MTAAPRIEVGGASTWRLPVGVAVATTATVGAAMVVLFLLVAPWLGGMGFAAPGSTSGSAWTPWFVALIIIALFGPPFAGGAAWGAAVARIADLPIGPAARTGAMAFGGMVMLTAPLVDLTQLLAVPRWMPLRTHGVIVSVFTLDVGVVAGVATWRLTRRMGLGRRAAVIGLRTGWGAAAGFLLGSVLALAIGFRVPGPPGLMVWAVASAAPVSTLVAGAVLGRSLDRVPP